MTSPNPIFIKEELESLRLDLDKSVKEFLKEHVLFFSTENIKGFDTYFMFCYDESIKWEEEEEEEEENNNNNSSPIKASRLFEWKMQDDHYHEYKFLANSYYLFVEQVENLYNKPFEVVKGRSPFFWYKIPKISTFNSWFFHCNIKNTTIQEYLQLNNSDNKAGKTKEDILNNIVLSIFNSDILNLKKIKKKPNKEKEDSFSPPIKESDLVHKDYISTMSENDSRGTSYIVTRAKTLDFSLGHSDSHSVSTNLTMVSAFDISNNSIIEKMIIQTKGEEEGGEE